MRSRIRWAGAFLAVVAVLLSIASLTGSLSLPFMGPSGAPATATGSVSWTLVVDGLVEHPLNLTYQDLTAMPSKSVTASIWCAGPPAFLVTNGTWTGVRLSTLLQRAGVLSDAVKVAFHATDGFTTDLTIEDATRPDVIVAYLKDGEPLGSADDPNPPLRLVVPGKWGYKWIRWLKRVELVDYDFKGSYESRGYSDKAEVYGPARE